MGHQIYKHESFLSIGGYKSSGFGFGYFVLAFSKCFAILISFQGKYGEIFYQLYEGYAPMRGEPKMCIVKSGVP